MCCNVEHSTDKIKNPSLFSEHHCTFTLCTSHCPKRFSSFSCIPNPGRWNWRGRFYQTRFVSLFSFTLFSVLTSIRAVRKRLRSSVISQAWTGASLKVVVTTCRSSARPRTLLAESLSLHILCNRCNGLEWVVFTVGR